MTMIYLDNAATTPVDQRVREAMLPYLNEKFGNGSNRARNNHDDLYRIQFRDGKKGG